MSTALRSLLVAVAAVVGVVAVLPVVLLSLPLLAVAALTGLLLDRLDLQPDHDPWDRLIEFAPEVGWRPKPNLDVLARGDEVFRLTTDADGWRGGTTLDDSDVVVFGDSFAFGHGIDDDGFFGNQLEGLSAKPIACDGYSMVHCLLWMRRLRTRLAGKLVVWFVYVGNDLYESLVPNLGPYRMPFVRREQATGRWEVAVDHVTPEPWPMPDGRAYVRLLAQVCTPGRLSRRVFGAAEHLIAEAGQLCAGAGARLVVVSVPAAAQYRQLDRLRRFSPDPERLDLDLPDDRLSRICAERGIPFVALRNHLDDSDYLRRDIHWTASGHRRVAGVIREIWDDQSVGRARSRSVPSRP